MGCGGAATAPPVPDAPPAAAASTGGGNPAGCVEDYDPEVDLFPDKAVLTHAERFAVDYFSHYKVVSIDDPWREGAAGYRYLLLQCGTPRPPGFEDAVVVEIPAHRVITTSTTELAAIDALELDERLIGHAGLGYIYSPAIRQRIDAGAVQEVSGGAQLNPEMVVAADPDLVLGDVLGNPEFDVGGMLAVLREAGLAVAIVPSYMEATPLGRAEWIKLVALFFNREAAAERFFAAVAARYAELAAQGRATDPATRPTVVTGLPSGGTWHVPGGRSYAAQLFADAGARYLWANDDATGSLALGLETVYARALDADVWLRPSSLASLAAIRAADARLATLAAFRNQRVYNNDARLGPTGGNDFWESGTLRPDLILSDFLAIFHPELLPEHEMVYHRRLR